MFLDEHARRCSLHWPTFLLIGSNIRPRLKNDGYRIAARCNWLPTEHLKRQNRKVYNLTIIFITKLISIISKCQFQLVWLFKPEEWSILRTNDDKKSTTDDNDGLDSGKVRKLVSSGKMGCTLCDGRTPLFAKIFTIDLHISSNPARE